MKKLKRLGIGLGLILIGMSGTAQAQTSPSVYATTIPMINDTMFQTEMADTIDHELSPPAPEPPTHPGSTSNDFDGNGVSDLAWYDAATGDFVVWLLDGQGSGRGVTIAQGVHDQTFAVADFNGDGRADILRHDRTKRTLAMWLMATDGTAQDVPVTYNNGPAELNPGWSVAGTGDYNGDGWADILVRSTGGEGQILFMNGATIIDVGTLPTLSGWQAIPGPDDATSGNVTDKPSG